VAVEAVVPSNKLLVLVVLVAEVLVVFSHLQRMVLLVQQTWVAVAVGLVLVLLLAVLAVRV
jgi:hypothetical protein